MRVKSFWMVVLLGLPAIAMADGAWGAAGEQAGPDGEPSIEGSEPPAVDPAGLDLRIDPSELPAQVPSTGLAGPGPARADHHLGAERSATDRGLSFGFEVQRRGRVDSPARTSESDEPGLQDNLERLIDRSAIGLRGTYRF